MTSSDLDLDTIEARANAAYPGPWNWRGNTEARHLRLQSPTHGGMTVMDFVRYGMNGAQPRFAIDGIMNKAEELVEYEVAAWSKDIYRKDVSAILHPDAEFIAHAREDVPALVAEVRRLRGRQLTASEYNTAWHAVEGAAGEEGADPGTVLHAVLDRLGIEWQDAARPAVVPAVGETGE